MFRVFLRWCLSNPLLLLGSFVLLVTTLFLGYKNGKIDMLYSDAISDHNLLQFPILKNDINIQAIHTHLFKWPLIILENLIGFTARTHVIFSFLLLLVMNTWLGYLFYKFSEKNSSVTGVSLLILASIEIMAGINADNGTLTMITIRNIEIPIIISLTYAIVGSSRLFSIKNILSVTLLALLFASDFLLLYIAVIGLPVFFVINQYDFKKRNFLLTNVKDLNIYLSTVAAAVGAKIIHQIVNLLGIANFYEMEGSNDKLTFIGSFEKMFLYTLEYVGEIIRVFGASFFGVNIFSGWMYAVNFLFFMFTIYLIVWLIKSHLHESSPSNEVKTLTIMLATYLFAMLAFTVLIPRELAGRYFAFVPVLGILILAYKFRDYRLKLPEKSAYLIVPAVSVLVLAFFTALILDANKLLYQKKYASYSSRLGDTAFIVDILEKENTPTLINMDHYEQGFWNNHVIKQQYDQKTQKQLSIVSVFCGGSVVDRQFSKRSWSVPNGSRVALRLRACDYEEMKSTFGVPSKAYVIDNDDTIYIYDHDIRNKLDMRQYDENRFFKN